MKDMQSQIVKCSVDLFAPGVPRLPRPPWKCSEKSATLVEQVEELAGAFLCMRAVTLEAE